MLYTEGAVGISQGNTGRVTGDYGIMGLFLRLTCGISVAYLYNSMEIILTAGIVAPT